MSDKVMKEVWRVNNNNGVPSDLGGFVFYLDGWKGWPLESAIKFDDCWRVDGKASREIYAYQTNRTREAKYELVDCDKCYGTGDYKSSDGRKSYRCPSCNGKGHTLEPIK